MTTKIFINLPVKDLNKSIEFFTALGFTFNPKFTDETATCMIIGENIFAMLLTEKRFKDFTKKEIADASKTTEVLIAIDVESKEKVVEMTEKAVAAGGSIYMDPADHGWMYQHSFADLDGHQWELLFMDETLIPEDFNKKEDTTGEEKKTEITVEAIVSGSVEKIWQCWTEPEHIMQWCNASDDWHAPNATNDIREGGKFSTRMEVKDGSFGFDFGGVYTTVIPFEKIEYVLGDSRKVSIDFLKQENEIKIIETFEAENQNPLDMQKAGWQAILDNFKKHTESF